MGKKIRNIIIGVAVVAVIVTIIVLIVINNENNRFKYNGDGAIGNTTGNLYNGGAFCQYEDRIYFANPADNNYLYSMKLDGSDVQLEYKDMVSYIQIINGYIYYIRTNRASTDVVLHGSLYGIFRMKIGSDKPLCLYTGIVESMVVCGDYIYFRSYDEKEQIQFKKVKVDGEELSIVSENDYDAVAAWKNEVYFTNVEDNHNLMYVMSGTDVVHTSSVGNYYMPSFSDNFFYYIDLDNDMKLTRMSLKNNEITVLDEGVCVNYNVSSEQGVIYYQLEDENQHRLRRMDIYGANKTTIADGDYCDIHITEKYTYYNMIVSVDLKQLYCVETKGNIIREVKFTAN